MTSANSAVNYKRPGKRNNMNNLQNQKNKRFSKEIFRTGEYTQHFKPDANFNPFKKIYNKKKLDTIDIINRYTGAKTILDVGGGMGRLSLELANSDQNNVFLTDISEDMLKLAAGEASKSNNLFRINADAHNLPFPDHYFDFVVGLDLFCHLAYPDKALREFRRVLTVSGLLIVDSTNSNSFWTLFYPRYLGKDPMIWFKIWQFHGIQPGWENIVHHYSKKKFVSFLLTAGFEPLHIINYGPKICPKWHLTVSKSLN